VAAARGIPDFLVAWRELDRRTGAIVSAEIPRSRSGISRHDPGISINRTHREPRGVACALARK
jgi:hypothetical protein